MAYSRPWDESTPSGGAQASGIDDSARSKLEDIRQRMNELVVDWTTDPVVPKAELSGKVTGKYKNYHWSAFNLLQTENYTIGANLQYLEDASVASTIPCNLNLSPGVVITEVIFLIDPNGGTGTTRLSRVNLATGAVENIYSPVNYSGSGIQQASSGVLSHTVADGFAYFLVWATATFGAPRLYGARVKHDVPDSRSLG